MNEAAAKTLKAAGVSKLPDVAALQAEYVKLQEQKEALYAEYGKRKKQVKEYDVIKRNVDSILKMERPLEREKEAEREYGFGWIFLHIHATIFNEDKRGSG